MNGMFWDQVVCNAKIEETTEKGSKTWSRCDGVMLPIYRQATYDSTGLAIIRTNEPVSLWKCHKCGREVK